MSDGDIASQAAGSGGSTSGTKWGSKGMSKLAYFWGSLTGRSIIGDAPNSLPGRRTCSNPFEWADHECIDPMPPMDNWLTNGYYLSL